MKLLVLTYVLFTKYILVESYTKVFKHDTDLYNPQNWVGGKKQETCDGLIFPKILTQTWLLDSINVKQIIFPTKGLLVLEEGNTITFDEDSTDDLNCVQIKEDTLHYWEDPDSWEIKEMPSNPAVPHLERIPCASDDVVLPTGLLDYFVSTNTGQLIFTAQDKFSQKVNSLKYGHNIIQNGQAMTGSNFGVFTTDTQNKCVDPTGCTCGNNVPFTCEFVVQLHKTDCLEPILPEGFCHEICGASLILKYKNGFSLREIQKKLEQYASYTYASKIIVNRTQEVVQVIFTEKNFSGNSLDEAQDFYELIQTDSSFKVKEIILFTSKRLDAYSNIHFWFIFVGTLLAVATFFSLLFASNSPRVLRIIRNARNNARPLSTYIYARYDANEDRGYIIENQSLAASVLTLNTTSFDNPAFLTNTQSTSDLRETEDVTTEIEAKEAVENLNEK